MIQLNLKYLLIAVLSIHTMKSQHTIIPLWEQEIPNSKKSDEVEFYPERDILFIEKIHTPTLEVFLPSETRGERKSCNHLSRWRVIVVFHTILRVQMLLSF